MRRQNDGQSWNGNVVSLLRRLQENDTRRQGKGSPYQQGLLAEGDAMASLRHT